MFAILIGELSVLLTYWQVWLGAVLFGIISRGAMRSYASSSLSNRDYSILMTSLSFLYVSVLVAWLGPILIFGQGAYSSGIGFYPFSTLFHLLMYGVLARVVLQYLPFPTPTPAAAGQGVIQLAILAYDFSLGKANLLPGGFLLFAFVVLGLGFILLIESLISAYRTETPVTTTVTVSGFLVTLPLLLYTAWLRTANSGLGWL